MIARPIGIFDAPDHRSARCRKQPAPDLCRWGVATLLEYQNITTVTAQAGDVFLGPLAPPLCNAPGVPGDLTRLVGKDGTSPLAVCSNPLAGQLEHGATPDC